MRRALAFVVRDVTADWRRSLAHIGAIMPIAAAFLILIAIAGGLRGQAEDVQAQDIVLLSPNALDPSSGRLDPDVLELAAEVADGEAVSVSPMIFRPIRMGDRVVQLRAAPYETWESVHDLALLAGSWPDEGDEIVITEGIAIATEWTVGSTAEIFGTEFEVAALVRAPGTKFASVWMRFERAQRLFEGRSGFQMVVVEPRADVDVVALRDRLETAAGNRYSVYFEADLADQQTARQGAAQNLATVATIVGIAALIFGGFNLAAIALAERSHDVGIGRAVGFDRGALGVVAMVRSALLGATGFVLGGAVAIAALGLTTATTVRSFVFEPVIPAGSWILGALLTIAMSTVGGWIAFDRVARSGVRDLLEGR